MTTADRIIRLVATDLDGTLLRSDGTISPRTLRVLATLQSRGIPFMIRHRPPAAHGADAHAATC